MKYIFQIVIGIGLIVSGVLQQKSIETYELRIYELLISDWTILPYFTRVLIALEIYLGISLILNVNPKNINTYLLTLFSAFVFYDLMWDLFINENHYYLNIWPFYKYFGVNYAYFKIIYALPLFALNLLLIRNKKSTDLKFRWIKFLFPIAALCFVFIYNAVFLSDVQEKEPEYNSELRFKDINENIKPKFEKIEDKGSKVLLFISLGCSHCFETTKKIAAIKRDHPNFEVELILFESTVVDKFQNYANSNFPFKEINPATFVQMTNGSVPRIVYVENGEIKKEWDGKAFNFAALNFIQNLN
jgi:hypothetical protein